MQCVIVGYYGYGNAGDEHNCLQTISLIRETYPNAIISVLYTEETQKPSIENVRFISRWKWTVVKNSIRTADILISGGGSVFQNQSSNRSLIYYLGICLLAQRSRTKMMLLGNGFGPVYGKLAQKLTRAIIRRIECHILRDTDAVKKLEEWGIKAHKTGDLTWMGKKVTQSAQKEGIGVLSLRPHPKLAVVQHVMQEIDADWMPLYVQKNQDETCLKPFFHATESLSVNFNSPFPKERSVKYGVVMRYHAGIYLALNGIPFCAIGTDPKLKSLSEELNQPFLDLNEDNLKLRLHETIRELKSSWEFYKGKVELLAKQAIKNSEKNRLYFKKEVT